MLSDKLNGSLGLAFLCDVGMRQYYTRCISYLIVIELTEVLHIHLTLIDVCNGSKAVKLCVGRCGAHRLNDIGKLSDTAGLNDDSVRIELVEHLYESL